jgi:hypothetical protein
MNRHYLTLKKYSQEDSVQAGLFLALILCLFFFDVLFLNRTLTALQVPGVLGSGPYGYMGEFTHRALIDAGGSSWGPRPYTVLISQQLKEGMIPLWNPYVGLGEPLAGNMGSNAFNPLRILLHLDPSPYMWDLFVLLRLYLAGFFAYLFLRAISLSHLSSLFSALLFMYSGYFIFSLDMHHLDVEVFLPFILLCYEKIIQKANLLKWGLLCSLGIIFLLNGGQPQSAFLILGIGFVYYFFRLLSFPENRRAKILGKFAGIYIFFLLLGFALSAPLLLPFLEFWKLSFNNHDPRLGYSLGLGYNPYFSDLVLFIVPYFLGQPHHSWLQDYSGHIMTRGYFGVTAALLAVAAVLAAVRKKSTGNSLVYFFAAALLLMMGKFYGFPLVNWIGGLPVANSVNFGKYMGPLMAFCTAVLAGIGLEKMARAEMETTALKKAAMILILVITITFFYFLRYMTDHSGALSHLAKFSPIFGYSVVNIVLLQVAVALFFMGAIIWGPKLCQRQKPFEGRRFQICILIIALVELFIYIPNPGLLKNRNERADIFKKAPYIDFLQTHLKEHRVVGVDRVLYPDFGTAFAIGDIRALSALLPKRYTEFMGNYFKLPNPPDRFTGDEGIDFGDKEIRRALNLLGVKYIISHTDIVSGHFIEDVLKRGKIVYTPGQPVSQWVSSSVLNINGITKKILFAHAPTRIDYALRVPEKTSLEFSIGLVPGSWAPDKGDGVLFEITLQEGGREKKIFSEYIDPKNRAQDRKWFDYSIDLSRYAGREVVLGLITSPGKNNAFDWSAWGDLCLKSQKENTRLVYNQEAKIYENDEVFPRAFVVHDYEVVSGKEEILNRLKSPDFPLRDKIVLEEKIPEAVRSRMAIPHRGGSEAQIKQYGSQQVEILAEMKSPGFLVLSDLYYPGWNAYVDGKKEKIYQTDYILRSVFLDEGTHTVKFVYEPSSFRMGVWISGSAALLIVILLLGKMLLRQRKRKLISSGNMGAP